MRRRSHLAVLLVTLITVSWSVVTTEPRGVLAADPESELAQTQARLADARAAHRSLQSTLARQRAELATLQQRSAQLDAQLDAARAELEAVTAEHTRVAGLLARVREEVAAVEAQIAELHVQIAALEAEMAIVSGEIRQRTEELEARQDLLEDHLRDAYARSQTSLLEVLLSASSLSEATTEVNYLLSVSDQDVVLAGQIRSLRAELETRRATLRDGRRALADARRVARDQEAVLKARRAELTELEARLAELQAAAERKRAEQEAALNASLSAQGDVEAKIAANERAAQAAANLASRLQSQAAAQEAAIAEARRLSGSHGFRWPEASFWITQEWGPTGFALEPPYTYRGTYYPHFHGGIDMANGCGTPVMSVGPGVVVASGQPTAPWDSAYGVIINHGNGIQSWYWHLQPIVLVHPGQVVVAGTRIGYEGTTGFSTGCHLHFAINHHNVWENPRAYLP